MSTVIYTAWRCPIDKFEDVLATFRKTMLSSVKERLVDYRDSLKPELLGDTPPHIKDKEGKKLWETAKRIDVLLELVKEAARMKQADPFDVECGLNIWFYKKYAYIIPIGPAWVYRNIPDKLPAWCEDFCYWNNVDEPEDISAEEWKERGKIWEKVCAYDHNERRLYHTVVECTDVMLIDIKHELGQGAFLKYLDKLKTK